jgi:hypothetical protein
MTLAATEAPAVWLAALLSDLAAGAEEAVRNAPDPGPPETYAEKRARWLKQSTETRTR